MSELITKDGMRRIALLTIVLAVLGALYYPFSPGYRERQKTNVAIRYRKDLQGRIDGQVRFERVIITNMNYADLGIGIEIAGRVFAQEDLDALIPLVSDEEPPVPVWWSLVAPTGDWTKIEIDFSTNGPAQ